jgi:hypothetical protein
MRSWNSRSSPASPMPRTKPRSRSAVSPTAGRCRGDLRPAGRGQHQRRHDRPEHLPRTARRPTSPSPCPNRRRTSGAARCSRRRPDIGYAAVEHATTSSRCRSSASACAATPASRPPVSGPRGEGHQHPRHHHLGDQDFRADRRRLYTELAVRTLHSLYGLDKQPERGFRREIDARRAAVGPPGGSAAPVTDERGDGGRRCVTWPAGPRLLLRRLREVMAEPIERAGTARQDRAS